MNNNVILNVENLTKDNGRDDSKTEALRGISFDALEANFWISCI